MARLVGVALITLFLPATGWSQPVHNIATSPYEVSRPAEPKSPSRHYGLSGDGDHSRRSEDGHGMLASVEVGPNSRIGFGMFGLKPHASYGSPVTNREINTRRSRRAGVGFSLKF